LRTWSADPEQEHFSDGVVDGIVTELSRGRGLFVIARNSSLFEDQQHPVVKRRHQLVGVRG
jgi:TolB-like protein